MRDFKCVWTFAIVVITTHGTLVTSNGNVSHHGTDILWKSDYHHPLRKELVTATDDPDGEPYDIINFDSPDRFRACERKLMIFASAAGNFTRCIVSYARPIRICEWCVDFYKIVQDVYSNITDDQDGHHCKNVLLGADRIQIIEQVYTQATTLWKSSNCDNCFNSKHQFTEDVITFNEMCNDTKVCIMRNNGTMCVSGSLGKCIPDSFGECVPNVVENCVASGQTNCSNCRAAACVNCSSSYHKLNVFYKGLVSKYSMENMCIDIIDMMNTTRKIWSKSLNCTQHNNDIFVLFTLVTFVCLFPIFFYLGSWIQSDEQKSKIVPQKRLASSRSAAHLCLN